MNRRRRPIRDRWSGCRPNPGNGGKPGGRAGVRRGASGVRPALGPTFEAWPDAGRGGEPAGGQPGGRGGGPGEPDRRAPVDERVGRAGGPDRGVAGGRVDRGADPVEHRAGLALWVARLDGRGRGAGRRPDARPGDRTPDRPQPRPPLQGVRDPPSRRRHPHRRPPGQPDPLHRRPVLPLWRIHPVRQARRPDPVRRQHLLPARRHPQAEGADARRLPGQEGVAGAVPGRHPGRDRQPLHRVRRRPGREGGPSAWRGRASSSWRRSPKGPEAPPGPCRTPTTSGWRSSARRPSSAWSRPRSSTSPTSGRSGRSWG